MYAVCVWFKWGLETDVLWMKWYLKWALKDECTLHQNMFFFLLSFQQDYDLFDKKKLSFFFHIGMHSAWTMPEQSGCVNIACTSQFELNLVSHIEKSKH